MHITQIPTQKLRIKHIFGRYRETNSKNDAQNLQKGFQPIVLGLLDLSSSDLAFDFSGATKVYDNRKTQFPPAAPRCY